MMATLYMGVIAAAGVLLVIVVLEATVLFLLKWGSLLKSLAASTAMNILSLAAGAAALTLVASLTRGFDMLDFLDGLFGAVAL